MRATVEPNWLPGETFFSLCARIKRLSCVANPNELAVRLFGSARVGYQHDFPTGLEAFTERSEGYWGSVEELLRQRTVLPYFLPFRSTSAADNAVAILRGTAAGMLKFQLGLLTSRFGANHPLKACPECMRRDRDQFQVAYWHLKHQYPSAWICATHHQPLLECTLKSTGVRRFDWCLPTESELRELTSPIAFGNVETTHLLRLAVDSKCLANLPRQFCFDPVKLCSAYRTQAIGTFGSDNPDWQSIGRTYLDHLTPILSIEPFANLPKSQEACCAELKRLLRPPRSGTHPIRHLVLISWLFESWAEFMTAYETSLQETALESMPPQAAALSQPDSRVANLLDLMKRDGYSASRAARQVGIDTATAMAWAATAGIVVGRRAKTLKPHIRAQLEARLKDGAQKKDVAHEFGVSVSTVTTTLRTTPGLREAWRRAQFERARKQQRIDWTNALTDHPGAGLKELRALIPASYAWLYRNDRAWLDQSNISVASKRHGNNSNIAWDERDRLLATAVERIGLDLHRSSADKSIPLGKILQHLPELKAKIGRLDRLPLTCRALSILTRRRYQARTSPLL